MAVVGQGWAQAAQAAGMDLAYHSGLCWRTSGGLELSLALLPSGHLGPERPGRAL